MLSAGPALGEDAATLAAKFGARQAVRQVSLSPDGTKLAVIAPRPGGGERLMVADLAGDGQLKSILASSGEDDRLSYCRWATDAMLACSVVITRDTGINDVGFSRMLAVPANGGGAKLLSKVGGVNALYAMQYGGGIIDWQAEGQPGRVLMLRQFVPEGREGTQIKSDREGLGVEAVDVETQKRSIVELPRGDASEYISDGQGTVRIVGFAPRNPEGYVKGVINYSYRKPGSRDWISLGKLLIDGQSSTGFNPVAVDREQNVVFGFDDADGRTALYKIALDGSLTKTVVLAHPQVDVDEVIRIGRNQRVVGASYATERRQTEFFDPDLKRLRAALGKALPNAPMIDFIDSSADERRLLLLASSDVDPGKFFLFDKTAKQLSEVLPIRPELAGMTFGTMKPVTFPAADGAQIPGYLTLPPGSAGKNLPAIVMPHGGPSARDEWGFDWLVQYFVARGFAVLQPNFRGSSGFGSEWFQKNGFQSWQSAIGDVNAAGRWLEAQGIAAPGKLAIVGWSYGGYAALQSPALDSGLYKAIVAIAPVTDLARLREEHRDYSDYRLVDQFIGQGPHVRAGSPTENVAAINAPVLLFHGDKDVNVGVGQSRAMADRLRAAGKPVEFVEFEGLDHQLDDQAARTRLLSQSDAFLRKALGL